MNYMKFYSKVARTHPPNPQSCRLAPSLNQPTGLVLYARTSAVARKGERSCISIRSPSLRQQRGGKKG